MLCFSSCFWPGRLVAYAGLPFAWRVQRSCGPLVSGFSSHDKLRSGTHSIVGIGREFDGPNSAAGCAERPRTHVFFSTPSVDHAFFTNEPASWFYACLFEQIDPLPSRFTFHDLVRLDPTLEEIKKGSLRCRFVSMLQISG